MANDKYFGSGVQLFVHHTRKDNKKHKALNRPLPTGFRFVLVLPTYWWTQTVNGEYFRVGVVVPYGMFQCRG